MVNDFLDNMIGSIYKILPLKESKNLHLSEYLDGILIQLSGAMSTYPQLSSNVNYIAIVNSIQYFSTNDFTERQCKREVFKCINNIKKIQREV